MQVAKNKVVTIGYTLKDDRGVLIDTSEGGEPLSYIQGQGNIIPGLEQALEGKSPGEAFSVTIPPEQAYGARDDGLMQAVPRDRFDVDDEVRVGMMFQTPTERGTQIVTVVDVDEQNVTVDANHPLAGVTLSFDIDVVDVRDATREELDHGHVHGPGGHDH